jgi:hypothetical protein
MCQEKAVAYFEVIFQYFTRMTEENNENLSGYPSPNRDLIPIAEYDAGVIVT